MEKERKFEIGNLDNLGSIDLGESAKKNIYPKIKFTLEEYEIVERYSNKIGFKKGTILQIAIREFIKNLSSEKGSK